MGDPESYLEVVKMSESERQENKMREIERYENKIRCDYSASIRNANPEVARWIEREISRSALTQYEDHCRRIETGGIRISDGR